MLRFVGSLGYQTGLTPEEFQPLPAGKSATPQVGKLALNPKPKAARSLATVAQAFQPAGSGDFPVASPLEHGTGKSREPADRNVRATTASARTPKLVSDFGPNACRRRLAKVSAGRGFVIGAVCLIMALHPAIANAQATLGLQLYSGLSVTGAVGTVCAVQATTNAADTNSWMTVDFIQLTTSNCLWTDVSTPATGRRFYRTVAIAPTNLVFIPPGTFRIGSPPTETNRNANEGPQMTVTLTRGFFMGKYLVTQAEYQAVVGFNPSQFIGELNRPVEKVSWNDSTNYCVLRTQQELAAGKIPVGSKYRLPTEAEWEYACRAGTADRRFFYGDDLGFTNLANYAWYNANSSFSTQPVGQKPPNQWGLYDMIGNVWAWVQDWDGVYPGGSVTDPQGPVSGFSRMMRGGCWNGVPQICRSAMREGAPASLGLNNFGLRVALAPGP